MPGIPKNLHVRLRETLLECGPFNNDAQLRVVFASDDLAPWRNQIPEANSPADRVDTIIYFLMNKHHSGRQQNVLVLLLEVLKDRTDSNDACYGKLTNLIEELRGLFQDASPPANSGDSPSTDPSNASTKTTSTTHSSRTNTFIAYSHQDKKYLEELQVHLKYFIRRDNIEVWDDTRIDPGSKWREEIEKALQSTKVAVLLVSANFLASDFIAQHELPSLLKKDITILPVIVSPCAFESSELAQYQAINAPSEPLTMMTQAKREAVWSEVAQLVWKLSTAPSNSL
jgi:hypothetical protein